MFVPDPQIPIAAGSASDLERVDAVIRVLYESLSFEKGSRPLLNQVGSLFAPKASIVRITEDGPASMDIRSFIGALQTLVDKGHLTYFLEVELARRTESFGDIAHVFSTFETRYGDEEGANRVRRGVASIQLYRRDERWWITGMVWDRETFSKPLPAAYLPL